MLELSGNELCPLRASNMSDMSTVHTYFGMLVGRGELRLIVVKAGRGSDSKERARSCTRLIDIHVLP